MIVDNTELHDVDIFDITNPRDPKFIADVDLVALAGAAGHRHHRQLRQRRQRLPPRHGREGDRRRADDARLLLGRRLPEAERQRPGEPGDHGRHGLRDERPAGHRPEDRTRASSGRRATPTRPSSATTTSSCWRRTRTSPPSVPARSRSTTARMRASTSRRSCPGGAGPSILPDRALNGPVAYGGYGCPAGSDAQRAGRGHRVPARIARRGRGADPRAAARSRVRPRRGLRRGRRHQQRRRRRLLPGRQGAQRCRGRLGRDHHRRTGIRRPGIRRTTR